MNQDEIYRIIEQQAKLKCGNLWDLMKANEQTNVMLKIAIIMIEECFSEASDGRA